ncbi:MAG: DUF86 domain-containing protein [Defluviitaleaceae bacterium]|nr:DUF86 domain-containing protein [Defluviitaleaceae bacterium]
MKRTCKQVLEHMLEHCNDIADAVSRIKTVEGMGADNLIRKAIVFSILDLGELTELLEKHINLSDGKIDWKGLKGMREIAAHRYKSMDSEIVWNVATHDMPEIHSYLSDKYKNLPSFQLSATCEE